MSFITKLWKDMVAEHPNRRTITDISSGTETTVDVARDVGTVSVIGDAFSASNMNDLETRISNEFTAQGADIAQNASDITELTENLTRIEKSTIYSATEEKIGTFLGVDLYRKQYYLPNFSVTDQSDFDSGIQTVGVVRSLRGMFKFDQVAGDNGIHPIPVCEYYVDTTVPAYFISVRLLANGTMSIRKRGWQNFTAPWIVLTIEYTKTLPQ